MPCKCRLILILFNTLSSIKVLIWQYYVLPKLILQPFVENAFFHAFQERQKGNIRVFVNEQDDLLVCEVMDDGIGMDGVQVQSAFMPGEKEQHFTGIGIDNVNARIKLLFGEQYGVTINSTPDYGTTVRITIPACKKQEPDIPKN